jgi:GH15 family glucan-1,4-alpha-glucosidase
MVLDMPAGRAVRVTSGGTGSPLRARYLPIAEHGLIGDLHTVALVGTYGTIDWYCCPRFDSPSDLHHRLTKSAGLGLVMTVSGPRGVPAG